MSAQNKIGDMLETLKNALCIDGNDPTDVSAATIMFFSASVVGAMRRHSMLQAEDVPDLAEHLTSCSEAWVNQKHAERLSSN